MFTDDSCSHQIDAMQIRSAKIRNMPDLPGMRHILRVSNDNSCIWIVTHTSSHCKRWREALEQPSSSSDPSPSSQQNNLPRTAPSSPRQPQSPRPPPRPTSARTQWTLPMEEGGMRAQSFDLCAPRDLGAHDDFTFLDHPFRDAAVAGAQPN